MDPKVCDLVTPIIDRLGAGMKGRLAGHIKGDTGAMTWHRREVRATKDTAMGGSGIEEHLQSVNNMVYGLIIERYPSCATPNPKR